MDTKFKCSKCDKCLSSKQNLVRHENKCNGLNSLQCEFCHKKFSSPPNKSRHKKNKICEKNGTMITSGNNNIIGDYNTVNNTTNNITNNITIEKLEINAFGKENIDFLKSEESLPFLKKCIFKGFRGLLELIRAHNFNDKYPENKNIVKENKRDKFIKVYNGKKWINRLCNDVIEDLLLNCTVLLDNVVDDELEESNNLSKFIKQIQQYLLLMKTLEIPYEQKYLYKKDKTGSKKNLYSTIDEFIYNESDTNPLEQTQTKLQILEKILKYNGIKLENLDTNIPTDIN